MLKRKATDVTATNAAKKKKCSLKFKPEWLRELVETEMPTASGKQLTKLGDIFTYSVSGSAVDIFLLWQKTFQVGVCWHRR